MEDKSKSYETIDVMLDGMGRDVTLSCGDGFFGDVNRRISEVKQQREKSVKISYFSLSLLMVVLVVNMICMVNVVDADNTAERDDQTLGYLLSTTQDSHDAYWVFGSNQ